MKLDLEGKDGEWVDNLSNMIKAYGQYHKIDPILLIEALKLNIKTLETMIQMNENETKN